MLHLRDSNVAIPNYTSLRYLVPIRDKFGGEPHTAVTNPEEVPVVTIRGEFRRYGSRKMVEQELGHRTVAVFGGGVRGICIGGWVVR
jgi:hypothetical protein